MAIYCCNLLIFVTNAKKNATNNVEFQISISGSGYVIQILTPFITRSGKVYWMKCCQFWKIVLGLRALNWKFFILSTDNQHQCHTFVRKAHRKIIIGSDTRWWQTHFSTVFCLCKLWDYDQLDMVFKASASTRDERSTPTM